MCAEMSADGVIRAREMVMSSMVLSDLNLGLILF